MACTKAELRDEAKSRNDAAALGDALLFTTMCIIGMAVDVHAKDGSVYSGIFHTASVDKDYAIVLKKARMIKKGNLEANVVNGSLIETLIVHSEDLVQVVAKGVILPSDGMSGYVGGDDMEAAIGHVECLDRDTELVKTKESKGNYEYKIQSRLSDKRENGFSHSSIVGKENPGGSLLENCSKRLDANYSAEIQTEEAVNIFDDGRYVCDGLQEAERECQNPIMFQDMIASGEVQDSSLSITSCEAQSSALHILESSMHLELQGTPFSRPGAHENQDEENAAMDGSALSVSTQPNTSVASTPVINVKSESCLSASSNPFLLVPAKGSSVKRTAKESKLNPGAKMFSPSVLQHRTGTPAVPNGATDPFMARIYTVSPMATAREEVDGTSFAHSSAPFKFVPYNNVAFGHGGNDGPYVQPVIGQVVNRTQPFRYAGQYQNLQTSYAYVHPNSQNHSQVMLGRGPLACMHPVSNDVVQSVSGFSPASIRPISNLHQVHPPKHQGNASAQLSMNPPIMANAPQPFIIPSSIPISQPVFPVLRPIAIPGANGFLSTKYA